MLRKVNDLDILVAQALQRDHPEASDKYGAPIIYGKRSLAFLVEKYQDFPQAWSPSTKWEDAGPILELMHGPDFLVRSMRAFVASRIK